jgi:hypothetical protein
MDSNGPRQHDFMSGYVDTRQHRYMNLGYRSSPYPGKTGMGDWGPHQGGGIFYRPENPTYPYLLDFSPYNPYPPSLAYAQDIPKCNRQVDMMTHYPHLLNTMPERSVHCASSGSCSTRPSTCSSTPTLARCSSCSS